LVIFAGTVLLPQTRLAGQSLLPGFRAPLLDEPASPSAFRDKVGQGGSGQGPSTSDAEIQELARALRYDPGLMYKFMHDYIHYDLMWGDVKGPYMTWMDRSGNGFDQASLMIALLKEAAEHGTKYIITDPNYVVGEIELSATQACEWLDIANDAETARKMLARAGLYGSVSEDGEGEITSMRLEHVWVKVKIDQQTYEFDPGFKSHTRKWGLLTQTLKQAMGYSGSEFISDAEEGMTWQYNYWTGNWVKDVNKPNIESDLIDYSTNLIDYIKTNYPAGDLADIIGGRTINPVAQSALPPSSLPYTVVSRDDEFDVDNVPNLYRTSLRIQHSGIDQTFFSSDIYGRRLTLKYNASNQPQLILDGTVKATGNATTPGQVYDLTVSVDHPYEPNDFDGTMTVKVTAGGFYQIVNGWGDMGTKILEKHRGLLQQYRHDGLADDSEQVLGESFALVGLTWLAQTSRMRSMAHEVGNAAAVVNHHMLGVAGQYTAPYIDMPAGHLGIVAYDSGELEAMFLTISGHASGYEHEVIRQLQDCNAVSTIELLDMANDRTTYDKLYETDTNSWSNVQSQLQGYSQAEKDQVSAYVTANFTVHLPQCGDLGEDDWTGTGFQALRFTEDCLTAGYLVTGGYSGGCATDANEYLSPSELLDRGYRRDGGHGAYSFGGTDLTIGNGGYPFGLSFGRQYTSHRRLEDGPMGLGWTHNLDITAQVRSDSFQALGEDSVVDAAAHIVALYVTWDILKSDYEDITENMIASLCQTWLMDQMMDNIVTIEQGGGITKFVKDPDGVYCPPPGTATKLTIQQDDTFRLKNNGGIFLDFDSDGRISQWSDAFGNIVDFTYTSGKLTQVASKIGGSEVSRSMSFSYTGDHITTVTDSASRSVSFSYDGDELTEYTNPDGNDTTYEYDATNDGQLIKIFSPVDQQNPFVTIVYDSLGRMKQQVDPNNYTYDYYLAEYRAEVLEPAQTDPNNVTTRFSTVSWSNEYLRPILAMDQLCRMTKLGYDGLLRPISVSHPSGMEDDLAYDENHNLFLASSISIEGSEDPNTEVHMEYDSYENEDGAWFNPRTKYIDPCDYETTYEYDPNVGTLLKITYPAVDPPDDMNRPVVQFTYYPDGQLETQTDAEGIITKYEYYDPNQGAGLKKTIVDYGGLNLTSEYTYDDVGNTTSIKDPRGNVTQFEYYASRLLKKTTAPSPLSYEMTCEYYADGKLKHVKQQTPEEGLIYFQSVTYNARGQKETEKGPYADGNDVGVNLTQYEYDVLGRPWKVTDAEGNVTETRYYPDGKVWRVTDAEDHNNVTYTYNADGSLQKVEDAKGNTTEYQYNGFMATDKITYGDGTSTEPGYDEIRRLDTVENRAGQITSVTYDGLHRVKTKVLPDSTITYKYDLTGRVIEIADNTGTTRNTYDDAGRLIKVQYPGDREVSYEYDAAGNRTKLTYPDDSFVTYEYDQLNRLIKIRNDANTVLSEYTYDSRSRRQELGYANGTSIQYQYDAASRLLNIDNQTDSAWHKYGYQYDKVGNRLSMLVNDTEQHTYNYDKIYQVTDVNYPAGYEYLASDTTFNYDYVGNRSSVVNGGTINYVSNELNQYTSVGDVWYEYDGNGNLTYDSMGFYSYDAENRLTKVINASGSVHGPLNPPLDNFDLTFTTGGDANWVGTTSEYCYGRDSAASGDIGASQESWMQTIVSGEGTLKFYYKKLAATDDNFRFTIDGQVKIGSYGSGVDWTEYSTNITGLGSHTLKWRRWKGSSGSSGTGGLWVDYLRWTSTIEPSIPLQQALDVGWPVVTSGDADWQKIAWGSYHDGDCAQSGSISDSQVSKIEAQPEGQGTVTFYWKVSSEEDCDYLEFYIDGVLEDRISGEVDWQQKSYGLTGSGSHSLLWQYVKDGSVYEGDDCGWVDWLQGPGTAPPQPDDPDPLADALDSELSFTTGGNGYWWSQSQVAYYDGDAAKSTYLSDDEQSWMQTTVDVNEQETVTFYWKVSSEEDSDYLQFYINGQLQDQTSGEVDWRKKSYTLSGSGTYTLKWRYVKDSSGSAGEDIGWVDALSLGSNPLSPPPGTLSEALDSDLIFTTSGAGIPYPRWESQSTTTYYDGDAAKSCYASHNEQRWLQTLVDVDDQETVAFYWKVSSEQGGDYLKFYIDGVLKDQISGEIGWQKKSYAVTGSGTHALQWCYVKNGSVSQGSDCGWVDYVQWTGLSPGHDPANWDTITYKYDLSGRRIKKTVDSYTTTYLHDGDHIIAEYDGNSNLVRKYVYGPRVDEPVCMIDLADSNAVYYYHFDGLGSVVALTDANGTTVQTYEYSVYGHVAASDPNHPNPFMFTGRQFDVENGLYYYRARYYNPYIGRFLQTDPIEYGDGMNMYAYCKNNPIKLLDPFGLKTAPPLEDPPFFSIPPRDPEAYGYPEYIIEVTGRIKIVPAAVQNPSMQAFIRGLKATAESAKWTFWVWTGYGIYSTLKGAPKPGLDTFWTTGGICGQIEWCLEHLDGITEALSKSGQRGYRAYFQVVELMETPRWVKWLGYPAPYIVTKLYWVEIRGLKGYLDLISEAQPPYPATFDDEYGYRTVEDAVNAAEWGLQAYRYREDGEYFDIRFWCNGWKGRWGR
jgi:RHS repeat-associated protein